MTKIQDQELCDLMKQAQDGDKAAYEALLKIVCGLLKSFLHQRIGHHEAAEDVLQDILVSIHSARHTFSLNRPFAPWMYAIARYRLADYWRRAFRIIEDELKDGMEPAAPEPANEMVRDELKQKISDALKRLPEKQKLAVTLLKMEGRSIREAAKKLDMSEAALKVTAHRAYKALRREFENENGYH